MRLFSHALPGSKRNMPRGSTVQNVVRVAPGQPLQPAEQTRHRLLLSRTRLFGLRAQSTLFDSKHENTKVAAIIRQKTLRFSVYGLLPICKQIVLLTNQVRLLPYIRLLSGI